MKHCPVCGTSLDECGGTDRNTYFVQCKRCGSYETTNQINSHISNLSREERIILSGWIFSQNQLREHPKLSIELINGIIKTPVPPLVERVRSLLFLLAKKFPKYRDKITSSDPQLQAVAYSDDQSEVNKIIELLLDEGLLMRPTSGGLTISPKGFLKLEEWSKKLVASDRCFVAMNFDKDHEYIWFEGLRPGIKAAGYEPVKINEEDYIGKIDDQIIAEIRRSRLLVADFSGQKHGVYYESGFAQGLNIPVFWTCKKNEIETDKLHFDIRQYNFIDWETTEELAERLQKRIEAVLGDGPLKGRKRDV